MGKFTAIVLFVGGFVVLGSAAMAANDNTFLTTAPEVAEEINMEPDMLIVARPNPGSIDVDLALLKADLGLAKKHVPVKRAAPVKKERTYSIQALHNGRLGEVVLAWEN
jgi:hypothetical protein